MQEKSTRRICRISTLFAEDSLVKVFQSQESGAGLPTQEELCSLKSLGLPQLKDLNIFCLRTYPDCYRMTEAGRLQPSSARFQSWGTTSRGRCLTARISVFPNPERECILSDILEKDAPEKYYLSQSQMERLLWKLSPERKETESTPQTERQSRLQVPQAGLREKQDCTM